MKITAQDNDTLERMVATCQPFEVNGYHGMQCRYGDGTRSYEVYAGNHLIAIMLDVDDRGWHVSFLNTKAANSAAASHLMLVINRYFDITEARRV